MNDHYLRNSSTGVKGVSVITRTYDSGNSYVYVVGQCRDKDRCARYTQISVHANGIEDALKNVCLYLSDVSAFPEHADADDLYRASYPAISIHVDQRLREINAEI